MAMNAMIEAVFSYNTDKVREVAARHPELLAERSESGRLPVEVAREAGYTRIEAALIRLGAPGNENYTEADYAEVLQSYIHELSHSHACAGWLEEIEFTVWCVCQREKLPKEDAYGFERIPDEDIDDINFLVDKCHRWFVWDDKEKGVRLIPLEKWLRLYDKWRENNPSSLK